MVGDVTGRQEGGVVGMGFLAFAGIQRCFFFQAEDGIRDYKVTGVQTCALPISMRAVIGLVSVNCRSRRPALTSKLISAGPRRSTALLAANRCGESWTSTTSESQRTRFSVPCDDRISTSKFCDCRVPANAMSESFPVAVPLNDARPCSVTGILS